VAVDPTSYVEGPALEPGRLKCCLDA